jgi:hypothetical protein
LITISNAHIFETPSDVHFGEVLRTLESVNEVVDLRNRIFVTDCVGIKPSMVEDRMLLSVVLWNKKQRSGVR